MKVNKVNVLCKQCNSVVYAEESDTVEQIADLEAVIIVQPVLNIEADVIKLAVDPLAEHLSSEIEITIGEMKHYQEQFNTAKNHLKELKKMVKHRVKAELLQAKI